MLSRIVVCLIAVVAVASASGSASAQVAPVPTSGLTVNHEEVGPLAAGPGNMLYVTGLFDRLATRSGHIAQFEASGARGMAWPDVDGNVHATASDGAGGWFIGGEFSHVAGQPRAGLAHLGPNGELDQAWAPSAYAPDDPLAHTVDVKALCVVGEVVYVGGYFTAINGQPRNGLAAVDAVGGRLRSWNPRPDGAVHALAAVPGTLYVGGAFTRVGSVVRRGLAAFDAVTGALTPWNPRVTPDTRDGVSALVIERGTLYAGGLFEAVSGRRRGGLAAFDVATGALTAWNPIVEGDGPVSALAVAGDTVYVGGWFYGVGKAERTGIAAVDARTGRLLPWRADVGGGSEANGETVSALTIVGDRLYVGGDFRSLAGERRDNLGAVSVMTGAPTDWNPRPSHAVYSIAASGDGLLAGGAFSGLDSHTRDGVAAIDLGTGALLPFDAGHADINAVAADGDAVFAAGELAPRGGRRRPAVVKLDARSGTAQHWYARLRAHGRTAAAVPLALYRGRLYVGGDFDHIGGQPRRSLAVVNARTGRVMRWRADVNGDVQSLVVDGYTLYVAGEFTRLGGHRRRNLAAIDLRSGRVTDWNPRPNGWITSVAVGHGRVYLGGFFTRIDGRRRPYLAAVSTSDGRLQPWRPRVNAQVDALAVIDDAVYVGGNFTSISGRRRENIAAIAADSGVPTAWDPGVNGPVRQLLATPLALVAAGYFTAVGGASQSHLAVFPHQAPPPAFRTDDPRA